MVITRSASQSSSGEGAAAPSVASDAAKCDWSLEEEVKLIEFLIDMKAKSEGTGFKKSVWTAVSVHMEQSRTKGALKMWSACQGKWNRVSSLPLT